MQQVSELVQERDHLRVLHGLGAAREVTDQASHRQLLARNAVDELEHRGVLVLVLAWMHIEIEPPDNVVAIPQFERLDVLVPGLCLPRNDADAEQVLHELQDAVARRFVVEVLAHDARIDVVLLTPYLAADERVLPGLQALCVRLFLPQPCEQNFVLGVLRFGRVFLEVREELGDALRRAGHLVGRDQFSVVVETDELRQFESRLDELPQDRIVLRIRTAVEQAQHLLAQGVAFRVLEEREDIRVLRRDKDLAIFVRWTSCNVVVGQPGEIVDGIQLEVAHVLANIAIELLANRGNFLVQSTNALASLFVLVHARQPVTEQGLLDGVPGLCIRVTRINCADPIVDGPRQGQVREELVD